MSSAGGFSKRAPRIDLRRPAAMVDSDGRESEVTILDVSSGGFRLEVSEAPRIGEFFTLRVEHGDEFPAQIRWALGAEAGGVFLTSAGYEQWEESGGMRMAEDKNGDKSEERRTGQRRRDADRRSDERYEGNKPQRDRRQSDRRS